MGFGEVFDSKLEADKNNRRKAESELNKGIVLGYTWRSSEDPIVIKDAIYQMPNCEAKI